MSAGVRGDLIEVALAKAGVDAGDAVMVGDAVWDMKAATWAGVVAVGVRSGGMSTDELEGAGAAAVYDDARDLLDHVEHPAAHGAGVHAQRAADIAGDALEEFKTLQARL